MCDALALSPTTMSMVKRQCALYHVRVQEHVQDWGQGARSKEREEFPGQPPVPGPRSGCLGSPTDTLQEDRIDRGDSALLSL